MSVKERLEEIEKSWHESCGDVRLLDPEDVDWFINTAKKQQKEIKELKTEIDSQIGNESELNKIIGSIRSENARLREALEFYADGDNYNGWRDNPGIIGNDGGEKARQALKE